MEIYEENRPSANGDTIDLMEMLDDMWKCFSKHWVSFLGVILLCTIAYTGIGIWRYHPSYESYVTFAVSKNQTSETDALVAERLANSFDYVLDSGDLEGIIRNELNLDEEAEFPASVTASSIEDMNFLTISVQTKDAEMSENILKCIITNYPGMAVQVVGAVDLITIDRSGQALAPVETFHPVVEACKGFLIGIVVVMGILLLIIWGDTTIRRYEDLKKNLNVPCLGTLPITRFKKRKKNLNTDISILNDQVPQSFKEAVNTLRTRVEKEMKEKKFHTLLITSSIPGEGKSTITANLAISLAQRSKRVLVIDGDLRHPSLHELFGVEKVDWGITDFLTGKAGLGDVITSYSELEIDMILGRKSVANPSGLLSSRMMQELLESVEDEYDYVLIDTPPSAMISDASVIAGNADAALYVVRQDYTKSRYVTEGVSLLSDSETEILGCVLNYAEAGITHYGYGKYGYGKYGYGKYRYE